MTDQTENELIFNWNIWYQSWLKNKILRHQREAGPAYQNIRAGIWVTSGRQDLCCSSPAELKIKIGLGSDVSLGKNFVSNGNTSLLRKVQCWQKSIVSVVHGCFSDELRIVCAWLTWTCCSSTAVMKVCGQWNLGSQTSNYFFSSKQFYNLVLHSLLCCYTTVLAGTWTRARDSWEVFSSQEMYQVILKGDVSDQPSAFFLNPVRKWSSSALIQNSSQCPSVCPWKSIDSFKTDVSLHSIRWPFKINLGSAVLWKNLFRFNKWTVSLQLNKLREITLGNNQVAAAGRFSLAWAL